MALPLPRAVLCRLARLSAEADVDRRPDDPRAHQQARQSLSPHDVMQGARVILLRPKNWAKHSFGLWLTAAAQRLHHNVLATALANKLARIAWTVLAQGRSYEARVEPKVT